MVRAQALLFMTDGAPAPGIAMVLGMHERTVFKWRKRFERDHPETKLAAAPRSGRPPALSGADCATILVEACRPPSDVGVPVTHWSSALLEHRSG